jgi:Fe(3+) dicitrate transport protein
MQKRILSSFLALFITISSAKTQTMAAVTSISDTLVVREMPAVMIIAQKDPLLTQVCGAAQYINAQQIERTAPLSGNEVLRQVPGLHIVDEDGLGLRANIGVRGLDPDRGATTLVLEDGIPIQLNPYGEPELYYTPAMERMSGLEVVKGSGQIKYGPRTIGGVVNYLSRPIPAQRETLVEIGGGMGGTLRTHIAHGNRMGQSGYLIDYLQKRADRVGVTGFSVHDILFKAQLATGHNSNLTLKAQYYREQSNATYIGLTQALYNSGAYNTVLAPDDGLEVKRFAFSFAHKALLRPNLRLSTQAYHYQTTRDWRRQDFSYDRAAPNRSQIFFGDTTNHTGAIYLLRSAALRNRAFGVTGAESLLSLQYHFGKCTNELETGVRYINEQATEMQFNTTKPTSRSGTLAVHEERPGHAISAFVQQHTTFGRFDMMLGLRAESYTFRRDILLAKNSAGLLRDTLLGAQTQTRVLIPGAALRYLPNTHWMIFAGLHKGFAPAGIKQAISATGIATQLDAQTSWNTELGIRAQPLAGLHIEATAFRLDFDKQVVPVSESSGQAGTGFTNAGATLHQGIEAALSYHWAQIAGTKHALGLRSMATFTRATFSSNRFIGIDLLNIKGYDLPYVPRWVSNQMLIYTTPSGLEAQLTLHTTSQQYTDILNTFEASPNGRTGLMSAFYTFDMHISVPISKLKSTFHITCKNLTNERYIASRRPQGVKVGVPILVMAGWKWRI